VTFKWRAKNQWVVIDLCHKNLYKMKKTTLSDNLIYQRKLKGYSQEDLSEKTTVGVRTIQRIEKGNVQPHLQTIKLLAAGLDINVDDLIILENPNEEVVESKWLFLFHSIPFVGFIIPFANIFIPLIIWAVKSKDNKMYDMHGKAVINFHSTINILFVISLLLFFPFPGFNYFGTAAVILYGVIVSIVNIFKAINSNTCYYPLSIPFLKINK